MAQPLPAGMEQEMHAPEQEAYDERPPWADFYGEAEEGEPEDEDEDARRAKVAEAKKKRQELVDKIKAEYYRNPKLNLSPEGTIRQKLDEYDLQELEDVYENIQVQKVFGGPLTAREEGLFTVLSAGLKYLTGIDIYDDLVADESIKVDLREATGGWLGPDAPLANLLSKTIAIVARRGRHLISPHEAPMERDGWVGPAPGRRGRSDADYIPQVAYTPAASQSAAQGAATPGSAARSASH